MKNLIGELKKRGVTRIAGFYVAVVWLSLQLAEIRFPAFDIPDSALRIILYVAIAGFPCVTLFAWYYEITDQGIQREDDLEHSGAQRLEVSRYIYMITIGSLVIALGISVYLNFRQAGDTPVEVPDNISVLIADIDNQTGDPIFNGSLEQALAIGLEGAPFISSFARHNALKIADQISEGEALDEARARLVSVREGIVLVLSGSITPDSSGFDMQLMAIDPQSGESIASAEAGAKNKADVLQAVGKLAAQIREALGDVTLVNGDMAANETFSAASLAAVQHYTQAQSLAQIGRDEQAIPLYQKAIEEDPEFGRAYSGWALSEFNLGHSEKSEELWEKTLALLDGMTEREQYRTLGLYYNLVTGNHKNAIENYKLLVENYPADAIGRNNLAVTYFFTRDFDNARKEGQKILEMYPGNPTFISNYALYAMYASDFDTAKAQSKALLALDDSYYKALLPLAMSELAQGNANAAKQAFEEMSQAGDRAASLSVTGLADIALYQGDYPRAIQLLEAGIADDLETGNDLARAGKLIALAEAQLLLNNPAEAIKTTEAALGISNKLSISVPAARIFLESGKIEKTVGILSQHASSLQQESRAAASLIEGGIHMAEGKLVQAVDALEDSLTRADAWFTHYGLGRAYLTGGYAAEALAEFQVCQRRLGEAAAIFLDDSPTFHYSAPLLYWLGVTKQELGMQSEARQDLESYLASQSDANKSDMINDARERLTQLGAGK